MVITNSIALIVILPQDYVHMNAVKQYGISVKNTTAGHVGVVEFARTINSVNDNFPYFCDFEVLLKYFVK